MHDDHAPRFRLAGAMALGGLMATALVIVGWSGAGREAKTIVADGATLAWYHGSHEWVVTSLRTGGVASRAGLQVGDAVDAIAGRPPGAAPFPDNPAGPMVLHVAARGDVGAHSLILRPTEVASREDPDRRGR